MSIPGILETSITNDPAQHAAVTRAMRHARARLNASTDDLRTVLNALFEPAKSFNPVAPSRINEGTPLSPADKATARELIAAGRDNAAVAAAIGCSVQAIVGVRVGMKKATTS